MTRCSKFFAKLLTDASGQDLVEYAFVVAFIALVAIASMQTLAGSILTALAGIGTHITNAV